MAYDVDIFEDREVVFVLTVGGTAATTVRLRDRPAQCPDFTPGILSG